MGQLLCNDVFYEVMRRMDGETLAIAGCANSTFRKASREESLWEDLCCKRWPSVKDPNARCVISELGGFQKLFSECSRLISIPDSLERNVLASGTCSTTTNTSLQSRDLVSCSSSNFASLVDVNFRGQVLFSKFVDGIPGADEFTEWFSSCPFRVDLIQSYFENDGEQSSQQQQQLQEHAFPDSEIKHGKVWKEICEGMKLSWILINKQSREVANLSSWKPVQSQRHWPTDNDFVLRYGSILTHSLARPVECSLVLKCRIQEHGKDTKQRKSIRLTELSMQLKEVVGGEHLNGRDSLPVLCLAAASTKCRDDKRIMKTHRNFLKRQNEIKVQELRHEWCLDVYIVLLVLGIASALFVFAKRIMAA